MAFAVRFGTTTKRVNSTLQPDTGGWYETSAAWKADKDLDRPTISIYYTADYPQWNYMYIPFLHAYYWITSIVTVRNNGYEISGAMDILATYKSDIVNTKCFIEYGFNTDASGNKTRLRDARQNVAEAPTITAKTVNIPSKGVLSNAGTFILSAVGSNGATLTFGLSGSEIGQLINKVSQDATTALQALTSIEDIVKYLTVQNVSQGSAISAIRNCTWIPVSKSAIPWTGRSYIWLGDFDTGVLADNITSDFVITDVTNVSIPWQVNDWRRMNCQLSMYVPYIGTVTIPVDQCNTATSLNVTWSCEILSGGICVRVETDTGYTVYTGSGSIGSPYPIGASNVPISNLVNGTVSAITGGIQAGAGALATISNPWDISGGVEQTIQGMEKIGNGYMQSITPVLQCSGSLGSSAAYGQEQTAKLTVLYYPPIDDAAFSAVYGHPVMAMGTPVAGYCKTRGFSCTGAMRGAEKSGISFYMDGGTFIE